MDGRFGQYPAQLRAYLPDSVCTHRYSGRQRLHGAHRLYPRSHPAPLWDARPVHVTADTGGRIRRRLRRARRHGDQGHSRYARAHGHHSHRTFYELSGQSAAVCLTRQHLFCGRQRTDPVLHFHHYHHHCVARFQAAHGLGAAQHGDSTFRHGAAPLPSAGHQKRVAPCI